MVVDMWRIFAQVHRELSWWRSRPFVSMSKFLFASKEGFIVFNINGEGKKRVQWKTNHKMVPKLLTSKSDLSL